MTEPNCQNCIHGLFKDQFVSMDMVDGTTFECKAGKHPDALFDIIYGHDRRLEYAKRCLAFTEGKPEWESIPNADDYGT